MRSDIDKSKKLYMVQDRDWFENFTKYEVDQYVRSRMIPQLDDIVSEWMNDEEFMQGVYDKETADIMNDKSWLETLSLYALAKNIQNLCSFNLSDMYESKNFKLKIREDFNDDYSYSTDMFAVVKDYLRKTFSNFDGLKYEFKEIPFDDGWFAEIIFTRPETGQKALFTCEYKDAYDGIIYATYNYQRNRNGKEDIFYTQKDFVNWLADEVEDRLY